MERSASGKNKWRSPRLVSLAAAALSVVALLILATMVSSGSISASVAANARSLHWANSLLGSAALVRAANAQAVVFAVDHNLGVASDEALEAALTEARVVRESLDASVKLQPVDAVSDPDLDAAIDRFLIVDEQVRIQIERGSVGAAVELSQGDFEVAFEGLERILTGEQASILQAIEETETASGRVASIATVIVTLLIPGAAISIYFLLARRQIRERRLSMESQLVAARELARVKDEFIASLSHELRTPLTSIYGFSELLLRDGVEDTVQTTELVTIINTESSELMRMVEDILTGARLDSGALTFDITAMDILPEIENVVEPFRRAGLEVTLSCLPAIVTADRMRFRQVLRNLISNAQKHGGSRIAIGTQVRGTDLVLAVVDNGPGVPIEIEGRLFERFVHDGSRALLTGSVGLGLAIARNLTEAMNGTLNYERIEDHTVFSMTLRVAASNSGALAIGRIRPSAGTLHPAVDGPRAA
ncbi:MAG TPA: HAMP domain-containing sensor histidine kinase [Acidimicrobiia bacterium]|nr:HAMP domain-containing sensor histidine kinase [Acidimicrobiia bacterium]